MDDDVRQSSTDRYALSQAYRWKAERDKAMQELRQLKERSRDTTVSACDLLPSDERDAIAWVREHGGLDSVKKLLDWVVGHCSTKQQLDYDFWLSGRVMYELGFDEDMADRGEVERRLLARLMPEGYEWPRYESGEPLRYEDRYVYDGRECEVWHVDFDSYGEPTILNKDGTRFHPDKGERVERPAPKDGKPLLDGDEVWRVKDGSGPYHVQEVRDGVSVCVGETHREFRPSQLTHRAPVIAADGEPLRVGETVWHVDNGIELTVIGLPRTGEYQAVRLRLDDGAVTGFDPDQLTHERPESWGRLEEDAKKDPCSYFGFDGEEQCGKCPASGKNCEQTMALDIVRRARALAERGE